MPRKQRSRRLPGKSTAIESRAHDPNHVWSYGFVADQTLDALRLRFLTLIDEFTREAIWIQTAWLLNSHDLVRVLGLVVESRDTPGIIKSDYVDDHLSIFRILLVPGVVESLPGSSCGD